MSYIGNSPGVASQRVVTTFTATSGQTTFTPSSGYTLGYCDVFFNGVKLVNGDDYTAADGTSVVLASGAAANDVVEVVAHFPRGLSDGYLKAEADARYPRVDTASQGLTSTQQGNARTNINAQAALGYTPVNKAGDSMSGPLDMSGNRLRDTSGTAKTHYNVTPHYDLYNSGSTAGALVIDTTIPYNASNMTSIKVAGYSYNTAHPWEISIGGYYGEGSFYALGAYTLGTPFGTNIFVARKTSTNTMSLIFGSTGNVYGTSIFVERFLQSYSDQNNSYATGWTISRITSTTGYQSITTVPLFTSVNQLSSPTTSGAYVTTSGAFGYGAYPGNYVLGWYQVNASSGYSYLHIKTNLWGGGSPGGNSAYIMGGFRITGYRYSTENIDDLLQFHNWSGSIAGLVRTCKGTDVSNTVYVGSDGYVYLRLTSGSSYVAYNVDLYQTLIYGTRDIRVASTTYSNSASL